MVSAELVGWAHNHAVPLDAALSAPVVVSSPSRTEVTVHTDRGCLLAPSSLPFGSIQVPTTTVLELATRPLSPKFSIWECPLCPAAAQLTPAADALARARYAWLHALEPLADVRRQLKTVVDPEQLPASVWAKLRAAAEHVDPALGFGPTSAEEPEASSTQAWLTEQLCAASADYVQLRRELAARSASTLSQPRVAVVVSTERSRANIPSLTSWALAAVPPLGWLAGANRVIWSAPAAVATDPASELIVLGPVPEHVHVPALLSLVSQLADFRLEQTWAPAFAAATAVLSPTSA